METECREVGTKEDRIKGMREKGKTECRGGEEEDWMWGRRDKGRQDVEKEGQRKTECRGGTKEDSIWECLQRITECTACTVYTLQYCKKLSFDAWQHCPDLLAFQ